MTSKSKISIFIVLYLRSQVKLRIYVNGAVRLVVMDYTLGLNSKDVSECFTATDGLLYSTK